MLLDVFKETKEKHQQALKNRFAREVLGSSIIRVFEKNSKNGLILSLTKKVDIDRLKKINNHSDYAKWHTVNLVPIAKEILKTNSNNKRISGGEKWGHAAKILNLYVFNCVLNNSALFTRKQSEILQNFLHVPIDNLIIKELKRCNQKVPSNNIKGITSKKHYDKFQEILSFHSKQINIPAIYFDDYVWGLRKN